eukprot:15253557-Alexandrium_andersonii.AAC.1
MEFGPSPDEIGEPDVGAEEAWRRGAQGASEAIDPEGEEAAVLRDLEDAAQAAADRLRSHGPPNGPSGFLCVDSWLEHAWGPWRQTQEQH